MPQVIAVGEALTDMIRQPNHQWLQIPGGAPWNVARTLAAWACRSAFAGAVSSDLFGDEIIKASRNAGLDLRFMQKVTRPPLLAFVHQVAPPDYFFAGGDSADLYFDPQLLPQNWNGALQWAHFGGISLSRQPLCETLLGMARSLKQQGVKISYDPNYRKLMGEDYDDILFEMCQVAHVIKVSSEDLCGLFRTRDEAGALRELRRLAPQAAIMHSLGASGARLLHESGEWISRPPQIKVVDTVGAGDAAMAGLLFSLLHFPDRDWDEHLQIAVAAGSASCQYAGAQAPALSRVQQVLQQMLLRMTPQRA
ncbi:carbohydrate kinase [Massilia sp. W12]|uniref:carbohydrate kinase family protein n=1 Tax=Massilia sp. W12 TaxID=3126507 RepID=UPI0030CC5970